MARNTPKNPYRIVIILPTDYAYARETLAGIRDAARPPVALTTQATFEPEHTGKNVLLFRVYGPNVGDQPAKIAQQFRAWHPDGVIVQSYRDELLAMLRDYGCPVIELYHTIGDAWFPHIEPDDNAVGIMAADYFISLGLRHFACVTDPTRPWSCRRQQGFCEGVRRAFDAHSAAATLPPRASLAGGFTFDVHEVPSGVEPVLWPMSWQADQHIAIGQWLKKLPKPLALFAGTDTWGAHLIELCWEAGLRVPEDVAVLGVDNDSLLCPLTNPPLSSIQAGFERIGRAAIISLINLLEGRGTPKNTIVPPVRVVPRQSTDTLAVEDPDLATAVTFIRRHVSQNIGVQDVLRAVPLNRRTLERRFLQVLGRTPLQEIHLTRAAAIKHHLLAGIPVKDIVERTGFTSAGYMARFFHKATGATLTAYRQQHAAALYDAD